jgi:hypothetical protein
VLFIDWSVDCSSLSSFQISSSWGAGVCVHRGQQEIGIARAWVPLNLVVELEPAAPFPRRDDTRWSTRWFLTKQLNSINPRLLASLYRRPENCWAWTGPNPKHK